MHVQQATASTPSGLRAQLQQQGVSAGGGIWAGALQRESNCVVLGDVDCRRSSLRPDAPGAPMTQARPVRQRGRWPASGAGCPPAPARCDMLDASAWESEMDSCSCLARSAAPTAAAMRQQARRNARVAASKGASTMGNVDLNVASAARTWQMHCMSAALHCCCCTMRAAAAAPLRARQAAT